MAEGVKLLLVVAGVAAAEVVVGRMDAGSLAQQRVNDLVLLAVRRQDQRGDVVGEPAGRTFLLDTANDSIHSPVLFAKSVLRGV